VTAEPALTTTTQPLSVQLQYALRRKIIVGEYAQGEVVTEQRIAQDLRVSRVPVREALPMLHQHGFIDSAPRRRSVVSSWTEERINNLFDARLGVEVMATGIAARRVGAGADPALVVSAIAESEKHLAGQAGVELAESNALVHVELVAAAGNELMDELMRVLSGRMAWLFYLTSGRDLHTQSHQHAAILDAIQSGNDRLAESLMFAHIEEGRRPTLETLT
jgi:DNA-binding GntR family transcriptional regulator